MGGKTTSTSAPKIANLSVQTSALGLCIPVGWGTSRVKCNLIWYGAFRAIAHTEKTGGGKGMGGGNVNTTYTYTASPMLAICEGGATGVAGVRTVYRDKDVLTLSSAGLTLFTGAPGQAGWGYLSSLYPLDYLNYSNTAYVAAQDYPLTDGASLQNHSFEVQFAIRVSGLDDANPAEIVPDVVGNSIYGVSGWPAGAIASMTNYSNYCLASGLLLSPLLDSQVTVSDFLSELSVASNTKIFFSEGKLKATPLGDTQLTGNSVTWTPDLTPMYDLTEDDFEEMPQKSIDDQTQAFNIVGVEFLDRSNQYNTAVMPAQDLSNIRQYGRRKQDPTTIHSICDAQVAQIVAQLILQQNIYQRDRYIFTIPSCYDLLEPTDLVTLTTTTDKLKLNRLLVRLTKITEDEDGKLKCEAIVVPTGMATAARYTAHSGGGVGVNTAVVPGSVTSPVLFVAPPQLTGFDPEIWLAASSTNANWGGCNVHLSVDGGATYREVGRIEDPARYGVLTSALADHADPDNTNTLAVNLANSVGTLVGVGAAEMNAGGTLSWIEGELVAYQGATLTSANHYNLSPLRRGLEGTAHAAHAIGARFVRLDDAIFKLSYKDLPVGDVVYVKMTSFNVYGMATEDISTVTAYSLTLPDADSRFSLALDEIIAISSDNVLSHGSEKQKAFIDYTAIINDLGSLDQKYIDLGSPSDLTTVKGAADTAVAALTTYLTGLSPSWTDTTVDTTIVAATFVSKWTDAYDKISDFRAAITGRAGDTQQTIYIRVLAPPSTPTGNTPAGWTTSVPSGTNTLWSSTGTFDGGGNLVGIWSTPTAISQHAPTGGYNPASTYYLTNDVTFNGGTYSALQNNFSGQAPSGTSSATAYWSVVSAPGDTGTPATPPSAFSATINLTSGAAENLRTIANAAGYTGASDATITFNVPSGVTVRGLSSGGVGIDTGLWPTSSYTIALTLVVQSGGIVDGGGGAGGPGDSYGENGGDAIYCQAPLTVNINSGGTVRGGGGGGGGKNVGTAGKNGGGGGGGGAPNGDGGFGGTGSLSDGTDGDFGTTSGGGAGGSPGGGAGGTFATAGSASATGNPGGLAGYAVRKNGKTVPVTNSGTMTGTAA